MSLGRPHAPYLPARIRDRLEVVDTPGRPGELCWLWQGFTRAGYGVYHPTRRGMVLVHRLTYAAARGPLTPGLVLDHVCHDPAWCEGGDACPHRRCANPWHVEEVAPARNSSRGRACHAGRARRDGVCRNGLHDTTAPGALYAYPDGRTECLACKRAARARASA